MRGLTDHEGGAVPTKGENAEGAGVEVEGLGFGELSLRSCGH